jgi:hypothetical protein
MVVMHIITIIIVNLKSNSYICGISCYIISSEAAKTFKLYY